MGLRNLEQNKILHSLLSKLGKDAKKKQAFALQVSNNRTCHTSELTESECDELIKMLQAQVNDQQKVAADKLHRARWRLRFALCNDWGFAKLIKGQNKPDFARIDEYSKKYWHKLIDEMTYDECRTKEASVHKSKNKPKNKQECHESPTPN